MVSSSSGHRLGLLMGAAAYVSWGLLPIFLRQLRPMPVTDILAHRVLWSRLILAVLIAALRRLPAVLAVARQPRVVLALAASSALIGFNWLLFLYAVNTGHVLQTSLGYFINPLINVLFGVLFLREGLGRPELVAVLLAGAGVLAFAVDQHALPVLALALAISFALYGFVRKVTPAGPIEGLLTETALLAPLSLGWLLLAPGAPAGVAWPPLWLLACSGLFTTIPLLLFAGAAQRIRFSELGLLQYISPTLTMLSAVFLFGEPLLPVHFVTFGLIWAGLAIYAVTTWHRGRVTPVIPE